VVAYDDHGSIVKQETWSGDDRRTMLESLRLVLAWEREGYEVAHETLTGVE